MPVFEALLPPRHDVVVLDMLFILCTWHAYAKLRLHTDSTLISLEETTQALGRILRRFSTIVCPIYDTKHLPSEEAARGRRKKKAKNKGKAPKKPSSSAFFNMYTYKLHALGDYVSSIRRYGPSDNYSTQVVSVSYCCIW